jgi:hypothetical protein
MGVDLLLNLVAELFGIVVTVFFVDRLIQKREEARWLPSKYYLYSRLISHFDEVMWAAAPFLMSGSKYIYEFGDAVATTLEVNVDFSNPETSKEIWSKVNKRLSEISSDQTAEVLHTLIREKEEIDKILASSIALIEPSLSSTLMKLQRVLGDAGSYAGMLYLDGKLQPTGFEIAAIIYSVAESAQNAKTWIVSKATNKISTEEFISELVDMAQKQESSRRKNGKRF